MDGRRMAREASMGFRVWRTQVPSAMEIAHTHPDVEVNCLLTGAIEYVLAGHRVRIGRGEMGVFWGGIPHQLVECSPDAGGVWITLPLSGVLRWALPRDFPGRLMKGQAVTAACESAVALQWLSDFARGANGRRFLLLELEAKLGRMADRAPQDRPLRASAVRSWQGDAPHVDRVVAYLSEHYAQPVSLSDLAETMGLHPKYLMALFKRRTGVSVGAYLLGLRLAHAQRLLATTDRPVIDVAAESGFGSLSRFYAAFSTHLRERPLAFRARQMG